MSLRIAINGFGRIGRNFLRACYEYDFYTKGIEIVAINDIGSIESMAHLLKFDSTHGAFQSEVEQVDGSLLVNGNKIIISHEENPEACAWKALNIDLVIESTGLFRSKALAGQHLDAGAEKVLIASVAFDEVDKTIVYGVNHRDLTAKDKIISAASCTTHCIAPVFKLLQNQFEIESILMTEMHAYTSDQQILDHVHRDLRRARSGAQNMIPTTSSSVGAIQNVLPELNGKISGYSMRVPINNVAAVDLNVLLSEAVDIESVNKLFREQGKQDLVAVCDLPLVSSDFVHRRESAIFDSTQTLVQGRQLKLVVWYDNEWGYVNRLLDLLMYMKEEF